MMFKIDASIESSSLRIKLIVKNKIFFMIKEEIWET